MRALRNRGLSVQPFKCGPDYIDPLFHQMAAGTASVNLDTFLATPQHIQHLCQHYGDGADIGIIEGAMGLFDGYDAMRGSAAEIAQLLRVPVILIISAQAVAYSVAPLIHGFRNFHPEVNVAGVIFNFVASERQLSTLHRACDDAGVPCLGYLRRRSDLVIPARHLGLTIQQAETTERLIQLAAEEVEQHVKTDDILAMAASSIPHSSSLIPHSPIPPTDLWPLRHFGDFPTLLVARDPAFNFTYRANLDALQPLAHVRFFSPLTDTTLPHCDLLYLPGGYPELFAQQLADNTAIRHAIRAYAEDGGHILAECGGFMYLCQDIDGTPMCGVLPLSATMQGARLHLGYRQMQHGTATLRGHEFHYSTVSASAPTPTLSVCCRQQDATGTPVPTPIYRYKNVIAGYTHWYWADTTENNPSTLSTND